MIHIRCDKEKISRLGLLCGDSNRTKLIAEKYLDSWELINEYRGLLAYTGYFKGKRLSVVTTGMGAPSACIVLEELIQAGAEVLIRVGTCGAVKENIQIGDLIIPTCAVPLVGILKNYGIETLPAQPDFEVLSKLVESTKVIPCSYHIGLICSSDAFYKEKEESLLWADKGVLAFEMECAGIFGIGYLRGIKTAAILTVVDKISDTQEYDPEDYKIKQAIERSIEVALSTIIKF